MTTIEFPALDDVLGKLSDRQKRLATIFEEAGADRDLSKVKSVDGGKDAVLAEIRKLNEEMNDLGLKRDEYVEIHRSLANVESDFGYEGAEPRAGKPPAKSLGTQIVESKGITQKEREVELDVEMKTLFSTSAGWAPTVLRGPRFVADEQRPIQVIDFIPQRTTDQTSIVYMEETTFTNAAAEVAEGDPKPEATLALTERTSPVRKIAVWIPVTDEQLEDVAGIGEYLDNRLTFMIRQRIDLQIVSGNGTAPNISGLLDLANTQTQAKGSDPTPDAIYKAMTKVMVTGQANPNLVIMHPNDWQEVRLLRTADGLYIWGSPSEDAPERIWGLTVAKVQAATEGTGIVLDTTFTEWAWKKGMTVKRTDSHGEYFISNKQVVLAEVRGAFTLFRPSAVCTVTGI